MGKWLEATIVEVNDSQVNSEPSQTQSTIKVHFKGYTPKWDETIRIDAIEGQRRLLEVGALSNAHGWAKYDQHYQNQLNSNIDNIQNLVNDTKIKYKRQQDTNNDKNVGSQSSGQ